MKIKLIEVFGFKSALAGLRKPFKGQIKTDISTIDNMNPEIHEDDLKLLKKLIKAGDEHAKCVRGIGVTLDITAPRFFWSEHDTYRVGVNSLSSESTMHTILKEDLSTKDFDNVDENVFDYFCDHIYSVKKDLEYGRCNNNTAILLIKQSLPESYLQTRTIQYSYQALRRIYFQRKNHRLPHWKEFCKFIETLPMSELIIGKND